MGNCIYSLGPRAAILQVCKHRSRWFPLQGKSLACAAERVEHVGRFALAVPVERAQVDGTVTAAQVILEELKELSLSYARQPEKRLGAGGPDLTEPGVDRLSAQLPLLVF